MTLYYVCKSHQISLPEAIFPLCHFLPGPINSPFFLPGSSTNGSARHPRVTLSLQASLSILSYTNLEFHSDWRPYYNPNTEWTFFPLFLCLSFSLMEVSFTFFLTLIICLSFNIRLRPCQWYIPILFFLTYFLNHSDLYFIIYCLLLFRKLFLKNTRCPINTYLINLKSPMVLTFTEIWYNMHKKTMLWF